MSSKHVSMELALNKKTRHVMCRVNFYKIIHLKYGGFSCNNTSREN